VEAIDITCNVSLLTYGINVLNVVMIVERMRMKYKYSMIMALHHPSFQSMTMVTSIPDGYEIEYNTDFWLQTTVLDEDELDDWVTDHPFKWHTVMVYDKEKIND